MRFRPQCFAVSLSLSILISSPGVINAQRGAQQDYSQRFAALAMARGLTDSARLHRLFDLDWEFSNVEYPENATYDGYPGQNDRWTDLSVAAIRRRDIARHRAWIAMQLLMRRPELDGFISVAPPANLYDFSFLAPCPSSGLIVHGEKDAVVPPKDVNTLVEKLKTQKGIVIDQQIIPGANHFFENNAPPGNWSSGQRSWRCQSSVLLSSTR